MLEKSYKDVSFWKIIFYRGFTSIFGVLSQMTDYPILTGDWLGEPRYLASFHKLNHFVLLHTGGLRGFNDNPLRAKMI